MIEAGPPWVTAGRLKESITPPAGARQVPAPLDLVMSIERTNDGPVNQGHALTSNISAVRQGQCCRIIRWADWPEQKCADRSSSNYTALLAKLGQRSIRAFFETLQRWRFVAC